MKVTAHDRNSERNSKRLHFHLLNPASSALFCSQIITALEEDTTAQKMQLGYRLQQIAAAVENKVTDL